MSTSSTPERRVADAMRARATGAGRSGLPPGPAPARSPFDVTTRTALLLAGLAGAVLGMILGLLSLLLPGLLPLIG